MARYIDADKAKETWSGEHPTQIAMRRIFDDLPTADVAPKSEVAREIFEDLENFRSQLKHYGFAYAALGHKLAELKKKYTEEKE